MNKILLLLGMSFLATPALAALFSDTPQDLASAQQHALSQGKQLVIALELSDCPQCQQMREQVFNQPSVEAAYQEHYQTAQIRLDDPQPIRTPEGQQRTPAEWAKKLGVVGTPAFVFFDAQGQLVTRYQGVLSAEDLIRLGQYVAQAQYEQQPFQPTAVAAPRHH